jgi:predicted amidohydrolase YtcJ
MRADFLVLDRDPLTATPEELRRTQVLETWINGTRVWNKAAPPIPSPADKGR